MDTFYQWLDSQLGNLIGLAGLVTGFIFFWLSRKPKRLGWEIISSTALVSFKGRSLPLKVVFDGEDVYSPNIVVLRLGNAGKKEIRSEDFDGPVRVSFDKGRLLATSVSNTSVEGITYDLDTSQENEIRIEPKLLNPREWLDIQFVTDGPLEEPRVFARVAGQLNDIQDVERARARVWGPVLVGGMLIAAGVPIVLWLSGVSMDDFAGIFMVGGFGIALTAIFRLANWSIWKKPRKRKGKER